MPLTEGIKSAIKGCIWAPLSVRGGVCARVTALADPHPAFSLSRRASRQLRSTAAEQADVPNLPGCSPPLRYRGTRVSHLTRSSKQVRAPAEPSAGRAEPARSASTSSCLLRVEVMLWSPLLGLDRQPPGVCGRSPAMQARSATPDVLDAGVMCRVAGRLGGPGCAFSTEVI